MKNIVLGTIIGALFGSFLTYFYLNNQEQKPLERSTIAQNESVQDKDKLDPYKKEWAGFKIEYTDEWNNGTPLEEQKLAYLRDIDKTRADKEFDPTKLTIVNYWASFCGPCLQEIPDLIDLYNNNIGKASFLAVFPEDDNRKNLRNIIEKTGFNWIQVTDKLNKENTNSTYPTTMVFSLIQGELLFKKVGSLNEDDITVIQKLIDNNQ